MARRRRVAEAEERGFTLVEVMFAMVLLVFLLLGLFTTLSFSRQAESFTREHQAASDASFRVMDALMSDPDPSRLVIAANNPVYAFEVFYSLSTAGTTLDEGNRRNLTPADSTFEALNTDLPGTTADESARPGHVTITQDPDGRGDNALVQIHVYVAWRGADGGNYRVDLVCRRYIA